MGSIVNISISKQHKRSRQDSSGLATFARMLGHEIDPSISGYQLIEDIPWFGGRVDDAGNIVGGIRYKLGIDGLSLLLVLLTTFLTPLCFLASWGSIKHRVTEYVAAFLIDRSSSETSLFSFFSFRRCSSC